MRLLVLVAVAFFILALICLLAPAQVLGEGWQVWAVAGFLSEAVDKLLGGYVVTVPRPR